MSRQPQKGPTVFAKLLDPKEFITAWKELSAVQQKAAECDEGPLLVLAGPGSGKTRVLTCRIARILDSSRNKNFRILALTFTNKAADEMRSRVTQFVPGLEERLFLGTFHSFCADVLRQHGTHSNINPNFRIYSQDIDLQAVLNDAVGEAKKISDIVSNLDKKTLPVIQRITMRRMSVAIDHLGDHIFGHRPSTIRQLKEEKS